MHSTKSNEVRKKLCQLKDKRELVNKKNVIYSIHCLVGNCNYKVNVGELLNEECKNVNIT